MNYLETHQAVLPDPGTQWTVDTEPDMITWFNNEITAQNFINSWIVDLLRIFYDGGIGSILESTFNYIQNGTNNITVNLTMKIFDVTKKLHSLGFTQSCIYANTKFKTESKLTEDGHEPSIYKHDNIAITKTIHSWICLFYHIILRKYT
jgi:hypothetical protein